MATQTTTRDQQNQASHQGQLATRGSQQQGLSARRGIYMTPAGLYRMSPFALMRRMSEELDRVFSESSGREQSERAWAPAVEVTERDGNYIVRAELAGLAPQDVKVEITDDAIVLEGERKEEREEERGGTHVTERRYGRFYRAIPLPEGAKADQARAVLQNGVLEVTVPTEEQKGQRREVPIEGGAQSEAGASGQSQATSAGVARSS